MAELQPVDLVTFEKNTIDWDLFRHGKACLFAITFQMGAALQRGEGDQAMRNTYEKLEGLLGTLDYIQERAARTLGEKQVFGDNTEQ